MAQEQQATEFAEMHRVHPISPVAASLEIFGISAQVYVALTQAKKAAYVTGYGQISEFVQ